MNFASFNTIETKRLSLELLSEQDYEFISELLNSRGWIKFIGNRNILTKADAIAYIKKIKDNAHINYWKVKLKYEETPIGLITLIKRSYLDYPDIGFAFLPNYFKCGYAFEAAGAVINYLSETNFTDAVYAETLPDNHISIQLILKLKLQFEREIIIENKKLWLYKSSFNK